MRSGRYGRVRTEGAPGCKIACTGSLRAVEQHQNPPRTFRHSLRVRYNECDPQGVVYNANWLTYFDLLMTELWRELIGDYMDMVEGGTDMVVAEATVRFLGPAGFDDVIDLDASLTRLGNTAISTRIEASVEGRPVASGDMRHVFIEPATKAKKQMPENVRAALEPLLAEAAPAAP